MRSLVSMMFASGCLRTMTRTARLPSAQPATRSFSTSSKTLATSPSCARRARVLGDDERLVAAWASKSWSFAPMADDWLVADDASPSASSTVVAPDRGAHVGRVDAHAGEGLRVVLHAHGGLLPAADGHLPDAVDLRDLLREDGVGRVEDLRERQRLARQRRG